MSEMPLTSLFIEVVWRWELSSDQQYVLSGVSYFLLPNFWLSLAFLVNAVRSCIISSLFFPGYESEDRPSYAWECLSLET